MVAGEERIVVQTRWMSLYGEMLIELDAASTDRHRRMQAVASDELERRSTPDAV